MSRPVLCGRRNNGARRPLCCRHTTTTDTAGSTIGLEWPLRCTSVRQSVGRPAVHENRLGSDIPLTARPVSTPAEWTRHQLHPDGRTDGRTRSSGHLGSSRTVIHSPCRGRVAVLVATLPALVHGASGITTRVRDAGWRPTTTDGRTDPAGDGRRAGGERANRCPRRRRPTLDSAKSPDGRLYTRRRPARSVGSSPDSTIDDWTLASGELPERVRGGALSMAAKGRLG